MITANVDTANGQGHTASGGKAMAYGLRAKGILSGVLDSGQWVGVGWVMTRGWVVVR